VNSEDRVTSRTERPPPAHPRRLDPLAQPEGPLYRNEVSISHQGVKRALDRLEPGGVE
jgi:hypothetical protein